MIELPIINVTVSESAIKIVQALSGDPMRGIDRTMPRVIVQTYPNGFHIIECEAGYEQALKIKAWIDSHLDIKKMPNINGEA